MNLVDIIEPVTPPASEPSAPLPRLRLAVLLLGLVLAGLVPFVVLRAAATYQLASGRRAIAEARLHDKADALAAVVDRDVMMQIAGLSAFAASPAFELSPELPDFSALYRHAVRVAAQIGNPITVVARDQRLILTTLVPLGTELPPDLAPSASGREAAARVFATNAPVVSNLQPVAASDTPEVAIAVPVSGADGQVALVAMVSYDPGHLRRLLVAEGLPDGTVAAVLDGNRRLITTSAASQDRLIGQLVRQQDMRPAAGLDSDLFRGRSLDGSERIFTFARLSSTPGWRLAILRPTTLYDEVWRDALLEVGGESLLVLALSAGLALLVSRQVLVPLRRLNNHARHIASSDGELPGLAASASFLPRSAVAELEALRRGFAAAETALHRRAATEQLALATLAATEGRLRELLATIDLGAFMTRDVAGTIRHWSQGCERLYGWTAAEAIGRISHELLGTRFPTPLADIEAILERDGIWEGDLRHRTRDGRELVVTARKLLRREAEGGALVLEILTDVTAQRRAELALGESEAHWRSLAESQPGLVFETDASGATTYINVHFQRFAGASGESLLGRDWFAALRPDDRDSLAAAWSEALLLGAAYEAEHLFHAADGTDRWFLCRAVPQLNAGKIRRWSGACTDVTEIVAAREALSQEAEKLEDLVEARTHALRDSELRLAQAAKMEALGRLAGGVAHDFNNVLQAVSGGVELATRRIGSDLVAAQSYLAHAMVALERGASVTKRLLAFARRSELSATSVSPAVLFDGLEPLLSHTLGPAVALRIVADPDLPDLFADPAQLDTVLVNLANNARDALKDGAGEIRLTAELATMPGTAPEHLPAGSYIRLSVADDGTGMSPEVLERVAEPFFTTKPMNKGTGLGLAMARGFAEQSGGALTIESRLGEGTNVSLWLPVAVVEKTENYPAADPGPEGTQGQCDGAVLLVDDEAMVRMVLGVILNEQGYTVTQAEDSRSALALVRAGLVVDVLVTDLSMPGSLDGIGLIREVRRCRPALPAILVTGHFGETQVSVLESAGSGPFAVLRKPISGSEMISKVGALLRGL